MTTLRQAAQQALEALDIVKLQYTQNRHVNEAITALKTALAQEHAMHDLARLGQEIEQEPSQWRDMVVVSLVREGIDKHRARELADHFAAQPEQEALKLMRAAVANDAWAISFQSLGQYRTALLKLIDTTPPVAQRPWQGLTTEEIKHLYPYVRSVWGKETFEAIEKALKERNHG